MTTLSAVSARGLRTLARSLCEADSRVMGTPERARHACCCLSTGSISTVTPGRVNAANIFSCLR